MKVLVTGAGGQVGSELVAHCRSRGDEVVAPARTALDVTDRDRVLAAVTADPPDAIIHCAAMTAVDGCEADLDGALSANTFAVRHMAEAARRVGAHLVHLSTDYVFDGCKSGPYDEADRPNPLSVYGRTKLAGEAEASAAGSTTIVRTSWVAGRHGSNVVKTCLRLATAGENPAFVDDQVGNPTIVSSLVPYLRRFAVERRPGLFHVTNQGSVSWFELARLVFELAGHDHGRVAPVTTDELRPRRPAPRPANSVLDNAALRLGGIPLPPHHSEPLAELVAALVDGR